VRERGDATILDFREMERDSARHPRLVQCGALPRVGLVKIPSRSFGQPSLLAATHEMLHAYEDGWIAAVN